MFLPALIWIGLAGSAQAEDSRSPFLPDYVRLQYAGQAGLFSAGPGYSWWDRRIETGLSYGFVPAFVAGRNIHIFSQKNSLSLVRFHLDSTIFLEPVMLGLATHISAGSKYEVLLPKSQRNYYWPDGRGATGHEIQFRHTARRNPRERPEPIGPEPE